MSKAKIGNIVTVTDETLERLIECEYLDETVMTPASIKKPEWVIIGKDSDGDHMAINRDVFTPDLLHAGEVLPRDLVWSHKYTFWIDENEIESVIGSIIIEGETA